MSTSVRWQAGALAALAVGLGLFAGPRNGSAADAKAAVDLYKPVMPKDVFTQVVNDEAKTLRDAVAKAADKKQAGKARSVALMIAVYAQDEAARGGTNAAEMAGLRDTALKLAKAIADGKLDDAKKLAGEIKATGVANPSAKMAPVAVQADFEIDTLMQVFKPERGGGLEWEKKLQMLRDKRSAYTAADFQTLVPLMYRIATIAQPTEAFAPEPMGKKTPEEWIKLSKEMASEALATAELAKKPKPDDKMVKTAVKRLEATCTSCHDKYRDTK
jgi:soluble cytochrome b562